MHLFIPGALPPAAVARELADQLPQRAPTLYGWMRRLPARVEIVDIHETGCTPAEVWALRRAGFRPDAGQRLSAGLGPLRAGIRAEDGCEPIWLADLVHLALGARHVTLTDPSQLVVTDDEDRALFEAVSEAVSPCSDGTGISLTRLSPGRWLAHLPVGLAAPSASPAAVSGARLDDWWPQGEVNRPWRRLLNEIQMIWHDHPVNAARAEQGQPPLNSLWLYGGARAWLSAHTSPTDKPAIVRADLAAPAAAGDWAAWLAALATLDRDALMPLAARRSPPRITLAGNDRLVTLAPSRTLLPDWFPWRSQHWKSWWSAQT